MFDTSFVSEFYARRGVFSNRRDSFYALSFLNSSAKSAM
ncbi:hypothetical protein HMPREF7215_1262 [Pyramidobacter piscolens W5455]|uniref:Uncharacterized protein n=1 Tax=Pyramidobacter piscolens W5455 TaxID=352165 RepID=A0ABM9ZW44_9BACT|nr:hypothetical protein HMPREF7215_1262 [Pyramidobacter piscolens W5455]